MHAARMVAAVAFALWVGVAPTHRASAAAADSGVMVAGGGGAPVSMGAAALAALPVVEVRVSFGTEHGPREAAFEGPLLWTVLDRAGAIDAKKPAGQVRQSITVTGRDGYTAVIALGEIAPEFEGKQVIVAERMDGQPLGDDHLRMVVPGDKRGGRSVRDVVSIAVTGADR